MNIMKEREKRICGYVKSEGYVPLLPEELLTVLDVPEQDKEIFYTMLNKLVLEERLTLSKKGRITPPKERVVGLLTGISKGNCILIYEEGEMFIPADNLNGAYHKDKVSAVMTEPAKGRGTRPTGMVTGILERGIKTVSAVFIKESKYSLCIPDDKRIGFNIIIPKDKRGGAVSGQKVLVEIENFGGSAPKGRVTRILGRDGDSEAETLSIIYQNEIPYEFPKEVLEEAEKTPAIVSQAELEGRADFRSYNIITIDGEDTRDFDDGVSIQKKDGLFVLGVHIADVAHYASYNSLIDREAFNRGNSVYLPDRVLPMLPEELSNGICSLIEGKDRLALSCVMEVDSNGNVVNHEIVESVIKISKRFTYTQVKAILEGEDQKLKEENAQYIEMLDLMKELELILDNKRVLRGALDFNAPESKVSVDKNGVVTDIRPYGRNIATKIIEEFMILANQTVAERYFWEGIPFVYRTHEAPDKEKIAELSIFLRNFGQAIKGGGNLHPKALQQILTQTDNTPQQRIISKSILRTMKQARYSAENKGHFGLSLQHYCHFTSPIRRYADLQVHRIIKDSFKNNRIQPEKLAERCARISARASKTERIAETVEREVIKLKMAEYMSGKIGEVFDGVISYVAKHGIYVELDNTVEGMAPLHLMYDDFYLFNNERMCFTGERTGKTYSLGDKVKVKLHSVSIKDRTIDFIFI